jgi:hypothetical protein
MAAGRRSSRTIRPFPPPTRRADRGRPDERYLAEFDFHYSNRSTLGIEDQERAQRALSGIVGRRLTYQGANQKLVEARDRLLASIGTSAPAQKPPKYAPKGVQIVYRSVKVGGADGAGETSAGHNAFRS